MKLRWKKGLLFFSVLLLFASFPFAAQGASSFEKSLAGFPESYRVILREVHEKHPKWVFKPMQTDLRFTDAVDAESSYNRSLVPASSTYSYIFKSHESGDYNASGDYFIQKDGGFCTANKYAVSYFMDPRNHFTDGGIFQFEDLSFDPAFNVDAIEVILSGTFMYKTKPTYYTSSGATKTSDETYAEMIYAAGKSYNINPCYLASKIRSEIGSTPSGSVTGRNSTYPGIYNYYNIGATDGSGAITRGLAWAANSSAGTYHRPWTSPKKSIVGGAEFLAATYIGQGQFTGYLQRFNVNPDSSYEVYQHQYMTALNGAAEQSYSSYYTYLSNGLLDNTFIFSIPVYEDMQGATDNSGTLTIEDAKNQTGTVSTTSNINVRKGPSQNYDKLDLTLSPGTKVTILDTCFTDTMYYDSILRYPNWYKVKFKQDGSSTTGYIPCGFVQIQTATTVGRGDYTPKTKGGRELKFRYVSLTPDKVSVVNDTSLKFKSNGTASVIAYDSTGRFAILRYNISSNATNPTTKATTEPSTKATTQPTTKPTTQPTTKPTTQPTTKPVAVNLSAPQNLKQNAGADDGVTIAWNAVQNASGYRVYLFDNASKSFQPQQTTAKPTATIKDLAVGKTYLIKIKAFLEKNGKSYWSDASDALTVYTTLGAPSGFKQSGSSSDSISLSWKAVNGASYYQVYRYDKASNSFQKLMTGGQTSCTVTALETDTAYRFKVRAVRDLPGGLLEGKLTDERKAVTGPAAVEGVTQLSSTSTGYRLSWNAVAGAAGYKVYSIDPQSYAYTLVGKTTKTKLKVTDLSPGELTVYVVKAFSKKDSGTYYGSNSTEYLASTCPAKVKSVTQIESGANNVSFSWKEVNNASGYGVYRYTGSGWKKIATLTETKAKVDSLPSGSIVKFRVRAFIRVNGQVLWGDYSDTCAATTIG